jgi:hypothetical protein
VVVQSDAIKAQSWLNNSFVLFKYNSCVNTTLVADSNCRFGPKMLVYVSLNNKMSYPRVDKNPDTLPSAYKEMMSPM